MSVKVNVAVSLPDCVGEKLNGRMQVALGAIVPAVNDVLLIDGQAVLPVVVRVKFVDEDKLGFVPELGIDIVSGVLPMFVTVTVCGLSVLVDPTAVDANVKLGATVEIGILMTRLFPVSAMYTVCEPSTHTAVGPESVMPVVDTTLST